MATTVLPLQPDSFTATRTAAWRFGQFVFFLFALGVHAAAAVALRSHPILAGLHAAVVAAIGLWAAVRWAPASIAIVAAYVAGAEVLWRMVAAPTPWELGKYLISAIFAISLVRLGRSARWRLLPIVYLLAVLPSIFVVLGDAQIPTTRVIRMASFNLSGPLAVGMSAWFLSHVRVTPEVLRRISLAFITPVIAIAVITLVSTYTATDLSFSDESNLVTSGGYGPNQVSSVLAAGAFLAVVVLLVVRLDLPQRLLWFGVMLLLATQSAMTFSRGGLYSAVGGILLGTPYLLRNPGTRRRLGFVIFAAVLIGGVAILPRLQALTTGALTERYSDAEPTNRQGLVKDDLRLWGDHLLLGVGPGNAKELREIVHGSGHTEFTRLLAEHGLLGLVALLSMVAMSVSAAQRGRSSIDRGVAVALLGDSMISMAHAALRISLFGFLFGFAAADFQLTTDPERAQFEGDVEDDFAS